MTRIVALALLALAVFAPDASAQREDLSVASGFAAPTSMAIAPDGRVFVAEQGGKLRVVKDGALLPDEFLKVAVTPTTERGLLGVAFDPQFASNRYVYVYYTRDSPVVNRLTRFTASASNPDVAEANSETVILDDIVPAASGYHNGGAIHFGPDGRLYVAVGEGHTGTNAQSLSTLAGKLLRIDRDGGIPTDNPFYGTASGNNRAIWALGLRNPFTFDIQRTTGRIFINDVGQDTYEEIDEAWSGPSDGGFNFGWPDTEGPTDDPDFKTPFYYYAQGTAQCAITGGAFYEPVTVNFPAGYVGDYFFADFCAGWIRSIDLATKQVTDFVGADATRGPVDIKVAADGSLYYLSRANSGPARLRRVRYVGAGEAPSVVGQPEDTTVTVGAPATFSASASGSGPLEYQWQREGADIAGATTDSYTLPAAQLEDDGAHFRVVVSNDSGTATSNAATLHVTTSLPPTAAIDAPARYSAGERIAYSATASDPEGGELTYLWQVDFHHESHHHPFLPETEGGPQGAFTVPTTGETSPTVWYRIHLTVRDDANLVTRTYRDVLPRTAGIRLDANVPGVSLRLDGQPHAAPYSVTGVVGIRRALAAPSPQTVGGRTYEFVSWSDGGPREHPIATPVAATTYTATFRELGGAAPATSLVPTVGTPLPSSARLTIRAPARMHWARARKPGIPVRVRGVPGARVRIVARAGRRRLGARSVRVGPGGERLIRVRVRSVATDRRRRVRISITAVLPDGRRLTRIHRILLVPRR